MQNYRTGQQMEFNYGDSYNSNPGYSQAIGRDYGFSKGYDPRQRIDSLLHYNRMENPKDYEGEKDDGEKKQKDQTPVWNSGGFIRTSLSFAA